MSIVVEAPTLAAGTAWKTKLTITWTGATITAVSAVLVDKIDGKLTVTEITDPVAMTNEGGGVWKAIFPATETSKLLSNSDDANSKLVYEKCYASFLVTGTDADGDALTPTLNSDEITVGRSPLAN